MSKEIIRNYGKSIRGKLLNIAKNGISIPVSMDTLAQVLTMDIGFGDIVTPAILLPVSFHTGKMRCRFLTKMP